MTGAIALAAYKPDPELFARQLRSLQAQTVEDFVCVISADGEPDHVRELVRESTGNDSRFSVSGFEERVGFYRNFERALRACPDDADWYGFSDQDDYWYPEKLERLIPALDEHTLVSGQARIVRYPSGAVIREKTDRRAVSLSEFLLINQFSGAMMLFRPEARALALPFPGLSSRSEVHDHWVAACAGALGTVTVIDEALQDYVQHGGNVIGEQSLQERRSDPLKTLGILRGIARKYEGSGSPLAMTRAVFQMGTGWRDLMVGTLSERLSSYSPQLVEAQQHFLRDGFTRYSKWLQNEQHEGVLDVGSVRELTVSRALAPLFRRKGQSGYGTHE